jgi:hypothetical protein
MKFAAKDTIKNRNKKSKADIRESIIIQLATSAATGSLGKLDPKLLTAENLSLPNSFGLNALHCAATHAKLHAVPKELLIEEILLAWDHNGQTALHYAAENNEIKWLPQSIITKENLMLQDAEGNSVYHYLANYGTLNSIPRTLIDKEAVLTENDFKKDVLDMAIHSEAREADPNLNQCQILLQCLDNKTLKEMIKKNPRDKLRIKSCNDQLSRNSVIKQIKKEERDMSFEI